MRRAFAPTMGSPLEVPNEPFVRGYLSGHARATPALQKQLAKMPKAQRSFKGFAERIEAIDTLALLIKQAMEIKQTKDGRVDMREVSAYVLEQMEKFG